MKSTGIIRGLDELGRIVLPKELRNTLNLNYKDNLEIYVDGEKIILKKYSVGDIFTGEMENLVEYNGKNVSLSSIKELVELAKDSGYKI